MTSKAELISSELPEITVSRLLDAPRDLVFKAFTDPDNLGRWWGPDGFTTSTHQMDFRVGGTWRFEMRGPDGKLYPNRSVYTAIKQPERIEYDHYAGDDDKIMFHAVIQLDAAAGKTRATFRLICGTIEQRDFLVSFGATEGAQQTLARLARYFSQSQIRTGAN